MNRPVGPSVRCPNSFKQSSALVEEEQADRFILSILCGNSTFNSGSIFGSGKLNFDTRECAFPALNVGWPDSELAE